MVALTRRAVLAGLSALGAMPAAAQAAWPNRPITHGARPAAGRLGRRHRPHHLGRSFDAARPAGRGRCAARRRRDLGGRAGRARGARRLHAARHSVRACGQRGDVPEARVPAGRGFHLHQHRHRVSVRAGDASGASRRRRSRISSPPARAQKEPLLYGGPNGTLQHLSVELFARTADIRVQLVPYRGSPQAVADLLGKRLDFMLDPPTAHLEAIKSGQLRALATTGATRFFALPDVPTVAEAGHHGFRHRLLAGRDRTGGVAGRHRQAAEQGGCRGAGRAGGGRAAQGAGQRSEALDARRVQEPGRSRYRQVDQGGLGREHRADLRESFA